MENPRKLPAVKTFTALSNPVFRQLWMAGIAWYLARWMELVVLSWLVLELTDSPGLVSLVGVSRMAPMFLLGLFAGSLADRLPKKRVMIGGQLLNLAATIFMVTVLLMDLAQPWHAYLVIFTTGVGWTLDFSSRRSLYAEIFDSHILTNALSLDVVALTASSALGPLFSGILISLLGFSGTYGVILALYVVSFPLLLTLQAGTISIKKADTPNLLFQVREAVRGIRVNRGIWTALTVTVGLNFFGFPYTQMVPVIARDVLGVESVLYGILFSAAGTGSMIGSLLIASRRIERMGTLYSLGAASMLGMVFLFALSPFYPLSYLLLFVSGLGMSGFATMQMIIVLKAVAPEMRGRASGAVALSIGASPLGTLLMGQLAELLGAQAAVQIMAGVGFLVLLTLHWRLPELRDKAVPRAAVTQATET